MTKEEIIEAYVQEVMTRLDNMSNMFSKTNVADRKHMENGFRYAVTSTVEILNSLLDEKKEVPKNGFRAFIDKQLGLAPVTQEDIDKERAKIEMAKVKLDLARIRAETSEFKKAGGDSPFAAFVKAGNAYSPISKKKKTDEK